MPPQWPFGSLSVVRPTSAKTPILAMLYPPAHTADAPKGAQYGIVRSFGPRRGRDRRQWRHMARAGKQPEHHTLAEWHTVLDSNLTSAFLCSHAAYPAMKEGGCGKVINIGSMMSIFGAPFAAAYAASNGGMVQMTKAMATAWAKDNIQVNAILPGWIDTALTRRARQEVQGLHESVLSARRPDAGGSRRFRGDRRLPGGAGLGLHHGRRDHGRRRLPPCKAESGRPGSRGLRKEVRITPHLDAARLRRQCPEPHEIGELALGVHLVEIVPAHLEGILEVARHGIGECEVLPDASIGLWP